MSIVLRIVTTGHDLSADVVDLLESGGHSVESVAANLIGNDWRPQHLPAVVVYGLSAQSSAALPEVATRMGKLFEVSFLVIVCDPDDEGLWAVLRKHQVNAAVAATACGAEFQHRLLAAQNLRQLDQMAKLSEDKLKRVRKTLDGFRHVDMDTGLSNRRAILERLTDMLHLTKRYKRPLSLVVFYLRNHSTLQETLDPDDLSQGYEEIADQLRLVQRSSDLVARTRADTFALMLPETPLEGAKIVAERTRKALEQRNTIGTDISAGVITSVDGMIDAFEMLKNAETLARKG